MNYVLNSEAYPEEFLMNSENRILYQADLKNVSEAQNVILLSRGLPASKKIVYKDEDSDVTVPGIYYGTKNEDGKFHFEPLYLGKEAFELVELAYSDRDWKGLMERRPIKISTEDKGFSKSERDSKSLYYIGNEYVTLDVEGDDFVFYPTWEKNFFFDEDVLSFSCRFTGELPPEQSFALYLQIYDSKKIWRKEIEIPLLCKRIGKNQYELSGICEMKYVDKSPYWNHYLWKMRCPAGAKGKLGELELTQMVSACLDLDGMATDYENSNDGSGQSFPHDENKSAGVQ